MIRPKLGERSRDDRRRCFSETGSPQRFIQRSRGGHAGTGGPFPALTAPAPVLTRPKSGGSIGTRRHRIDAAISAPRDPDQTAPPEVDSVETPLVSRRIGQDSPPDRAGAPSRLMLGRNAALSHPPSSRGPSLPPGAPRPPIPFLLHPRPPETSMIPSLSRTRESGSRAPVPARLTPRVLTLLGSKWLPALPPFPLGWRLGGLGRSGSPCP